jgi:GNAT superfamily N-acetyltransferase
LLRYGAITIENFKIINGTELNSVQIHDITSLHLETGYYEYFSLKNKLNMEPLLFQSLQTIRPFLKYTYGLINSNNKIVGFFIAGTKSQIEEVEQNTPNYYRDDSNTRIFFERLKLLYDYSILDTDFVLYSVAIDYLWRGKGLFKKLYNRVIELAKANFCKRIVFVVWASKPALAIYIHLGAKIMSKMDFTNILINDILIKCYFKL